MAEVGEGPWRTFNPIHCSKQSPRVGSPGLSPDGFWVSPRTEISQIRSSPYDTCKAYLKYCMMNTILLLRYSYWHESLQNYSMFIGDTECAPLNVHIFHLWDPVWNMGTFWNKTSDMVLVSLYAKIQRKDYYYKTALEHFRLFSDQTLFHQKSSYQLYYWYLKEKSRLWMIHDMSLVFWEGRSTCCPPYWRLWGWRKFQALWF